MKNKMIDKYKTPLPIEIIEKNNIITNQEETLSVFKSLISRCNDDGDLFMMTKQYAIEYLARDGYDVEAIFFKNSDVFIDTVSNFRDYLSCPAYLFNDYMEYGSEYFPFNCIIFVKKKKLLSISEVLQDAKRVMVFEKVSSPVVLGIIIRHVSALGFDAIIFTSGCPDVFDKDVIRTSTANLLNIPFTIVDKLQGDTYDTLINMGYKIVSYANKNDVDYLSPDDDCFKKIDRLAYVFSEEDEEYRDIEVPSHYYIKLPDRINVLDIAQRFSIIAYELGGK